MMKRIFFMFFLPVVLAAEGIPEIKPRMVIVIIADHMNSEHFNRYGTTFTGGFKWMAENGILLSDCYHDFAETATGPGHYTISSGQYPGPAGIVGNSWYDRKLKRSVYCVEDRQATDLISGESSMSFRSIETETVGDWLKAKDPRSRVYSVAGKDRSSVMMGGKNPDLAIWYNWRGQFTSSSYYTDELPEWLVQYNRDMNIISYRDSLWERERNPEFYERHARRDHFNGEKDSYRSLEYSPVFPIGFDSYNDDDMVLSNIGGRPWLDKLTIELARTIIQEEELGRDDVPDLLFVSLSALDWMIHDYGPFSQETLDALLKIDGYLGKFLKYIDAEIGLENVLLVLTADHGGMALPEYLAEFENRNSGRINNADLANALVNAAEEIRRKFGLRDILKRSGKGIYFDQDRIGESGFDMKEIEDITAAHFLKIDGIKRVIRTKVLTDGSSLTPLLRLYGNSFHEENGPDLILQPEEFWVYKYPYGTSHGTPWGYDRQVTTVFSGAGLRTGVIDDVITTLDIAPTIARILGVEVPESVEGDNIFNKIDINKFVTKDEY